MFRQDEIIVGGWHEKTIEAMQRRRFEQTVSMLPPLGAGRLEALSPAAFERKLEQCWQDFERKPMRTQQIQEVWKCVLSSIEIQADCLSREEHALVERALILGGSAQIEDAAELEAARALSLRLWASVGLVSGKPYIELEEPIIRPAAQAFARLEHEEVRQRLEVFSTKLTSVLYRVGMMDDRQPHQVVLREVLGTSDDETILQLSRRYLWASCDCVDYAGGVMLIHPALAEPRRMIGSWQRRHNAWVFRQQNSWMENGDILPEEIPLQRALESRIAGALRNGFQAQDVARSIRFLCKQGAPLSAMYEILQEALIVCISPSMRGALRDMYYTIPKWIESAETGALQ